MATFENVRTGRTLTVGDGSKAEKRRDASPRWRRVQAVPEPPVEPDAPAFDPDYDYQSD